MCRDLKIIEKYLGDMFMPAFATSIVNKQLQDLGIDRMDYSRAILTPLLNQIEKKVLLNFKGTESRKIIKEIKRMITEESQEVR